MKKILDWHSRKVVDVMDELPLWSAPSGKMLLENMPMKAKAKVLDLGCGTGFPLVELAQRFGEDSLIYGVDIWNEAIERAECKINVLELSNVIILNKHAQRLSIPDEQIDIAVSNLGVNNFTEKPVGLQTKVVQEAKKLSYTF
jgi:ubiquinone/menaquinone biosynthesis C-methylase UbiE